jgi:hypothetical protein
MARKKAKSLGKKAMKRTKGGAGAAQDLAPLKYKSPSFKTTVKQF